MKRLCYSSLFFILLLSTTLLGASKSAVMYFAKDISYPMVGVHDYIFVHPQHIDVYEHGFKVYKKKIYPKVLVKDGYEQVVSSLLHKGYENIYFVVNHQVNKKAFARFLSSLNEQGVKIALYGDENLIQAVHQYLHAIVAFNVLENRSFPLQKYKKYRCDIIDIETRYKDEVFNATDKLHAIEKQGMIPYITTRAFNIYGLTAKKVIKREILTLIDEKNVDRILSSAHQYGAMPLEYMGYIQSIHDIDKPFPDVDTMKTQYAGVVVWLSTDTKDFDRLFNWILKVMEKKIPVAFASNFGFIADGMLLGQIGIGVADGDASLKNKKFIVKRDPMVGFETEPQINDSTLYLQPIHPTKEILTYEDQNGSTSTPVALMPWGGYAVFGSFLFELDDNNLWVIDPFKFFKQALRLQDIPVPDVTTQNGKRVMFTHIDGDGIMNAFESDPQRLSGDMIYSEILKPYKIPHSVSVIGAEIAPNGLYPKLSPRLMDIARKFYSLDNVEPATHTFTHPFKWGKVKNDTLGPNFRLNPKGYKFSLYNELQAPLDFIKYKLMKRSNHKKAQTVFWSGDCSPRENALSFIYKHNLLNINGGYTTISNTEPWLTLVSPLGLRRGGYYQVYTGEQNENVYTNDWLGPFWGYKKVVQTFKMTNTPKRLKPIDVYYHLYTGSKVASLNAVKYVLNWCLQQDVVPIYTSEYIPKVMDYYTVSMAKDGHNSYIVAGMDNLKTLRVDGDENVDFQDSPTVLGEKKYLDTTYIHLDKHTRHYVRLSRKIPHESYLVSANGFVSKYLIGKHTKRYTIQSYIDPIVSLHVPDGCKVLSVAKYFKKSITGETVTLFYKNQKKVSVDVICQ